MKKSLVLLLTCLVCVSWCFAEEEKTDVTAVASPINKVLLIGRYDAGGVMNMLGGMAGGDEERPGTCFPQMGFDPVEALNNSGGYLTINYDVNSAGSFTYYWIKTGTEKDAVTGNTNVLDLSGYQYLSFWVKGANGRERFKIEIHEDTDKDGRYTAGKDQSSAVYIDKYLLKGMVDTDWAKIVLPTAEFNKIQNWQNIAEIVFVFENYISVEKVGTVFIDELLFGKDYVARDKVNKNPDIELVSVKVNDNPLLDGYTFDIKNEISIELKDQNLETIETVRVLFKRAQDMQWKVIGSDFASGTNVFTINWTAIEVDENDTFSVKLFSEDLYGNRKEIGPEYTNCHANPVTDEVFIEALIRDAFNFFWENWHHGTGMFSDSSRNEYSSIAATGFGLSAYCIGAERGYVDTEVVRERVNRTLDTLIDTSPRKSGFYYHFVNMNDGKRHGRSEVSTVDTALLLCGMIVAAEYFGGEIKEKVDKIYSEIKWEDFINKDEDHPNYNLFYMGWLPDGSTDGRYLDAYWNYYSDEVMIISLLAIGSPTYPIDSDYFYNWKREKGKYEKGKEFVYSFTGGLFSYQYAHAWYDLRKKKDAEGIDWFQNSIDATLGNRQFCIDTMEEYSTYGPNSWGIASMAFPRVVTPPQKELRRAGQLSEEYTMNFGPTPNGRGFALHDGTISPTGPGGAFVFTPEYSIRALRYFAKEFPQLWGPYGLTTSYNLNMKWWSRTTYGIDAGILLLSLENYMTGFVWKNFMKNVNVQESLKKSGFENYEVDYKLEMAEKIATEKVYETVETTRSEFLIEDFDNASVTGKQNFGTWDKDPEDTTQFCEMEIDPVNRKGDSGASLKLKYDVESTNPAFNGFWIKLPEKDYSLYSHVSVTVKGGKDGYPSKFKIELKGKSGIGYAYVTTTSEDWTKIDVPLQSFKGLKDFKDLSELVLVFEDQTVGKKTGSLYLEDIVFETK